MLLIFALLKLLHFLPCEQVSVIATVQTVVFLIPLHQHSLQTIGFMFLRGCSLLQDGEEELEQCGG